MGGQHPVTITRGLVKQYHSMSFTLVRTQNFARNNRVNMFICIQPQFDFVRSQGSAQPEGTRSGFHNVKVGPGFQVRAKNLKPFLVGKTRLTEIN